MRTQQCKHAFLPYCVNTCTLISWYFTKKCSVWCSKEKYNNNTRLEAEQKRGK
jgi:hypothetical protein